MSMEWTARVWASSEPALASERLLLLALADMANEEGVCWPSVGTLAARCAVDERTVRRNLGHLEARRLVAREFRPGRSTRYRLREPARPDATGRPDVPEDGPACPPAPDENGRVGRAPAPAITVRESRFGWYCKLDSTGDGAREAGPPVEAPGRDLTRMLTERGVHEPVARRLARQHDAASICRYVEAFDRRRASGHEPRSPGWLVAAIQNAYHLDPADDPARLFTHQEAMDWLHREGVSLSPMNPFTRWFIPVRQPDGTARFRRLNPATP